MNQFRVISDYWKKEYSEKIKDNRDYEASEQFKQLAAFFAPGRSYYYIVNFHNLELDLVSRSVEDFIGIDSESVSMQDLLKTALPTEIDDIQRKENVIKDFFLRFLDPKDILSYKVLYTYQMEDAQSRVLTILHQATPLSVTEDGMFQHVFSVHSDISYLKAISTREVSFVNLHTGKSFYNINISHGYFDPKFSVFEEDSLKSILSEREKEIVSEMAKGLNANEIAHALNLSPHTIKTHRKNILDKSGCRNTPQLVATCLMGGVISL